MRQTIGMLLTIILVFSIATIALARGAPTKQKAFTSNVAIEVVSPTLVTAPVMTGYDVIQNISTETRDLSIAQNTLKVDTSARTRLSSTRAWRSNATGGGTARSSPIPRKKR